MSRGLQRGKTDILERVTTGYLVCLLTVFLLYVGPGGYAEITIHKWRAFCYFIRRLSRIILDSADRTGLSWRKKAAGSWTAGRVAVLAQHAKVADRLLVL